MLASVDVSAGDTAGDSLQNGSSVWLKAFKLVELHLYRHAALHTIRDPCHSQPFDEIALLRSFLFHGISRSGTATSTASKNFSKSSIELKQYDVRDQRIAQFVRKIPECADI